MKRLAALLLAGALMLGGVALAEEGFILLEHAVLSGMDTSWYQGYAPSVAGDAVTIQLPVQSEASNGKLTATWVPDDPEISPIRSRNLSGEFRRSEGVFAVKLRFQLSAARVNGDYRGRVVLEGKDGEGRPLRAEFPGVIRIRDGKAPEGGPEIADVSGDLRLGEAGEIALTLTNGCRYGDMENIRLVVRDEKGEILPAGSDTLRPGSLLPGEAVRLGYPVLVRADGTVAPHSLSVELTCTLAGEERAWKEGFTLPVTQEIRLEQGGIQMAASAVQGDVAALTLPLMNLGRGTLCNVMATLVLPGVTEGQSVLVGTLEPGETGQARISFQPGRDALGELAGEVRVRCEDLWGNEAGFSVPLSLRVEAPAPVPEQIARAGEEAPKTPAWLLYALAGGCGVLAVLLVAQGALLRGKLRRMEEERL